MGTLGVGLAVSAVAACSGNEFTAEEDATGSGGATTGGASSSTSGAPAADGSGGGSAPPPENPPPANYSCPANPPIVNAVCAVESLYCSYGNNPRPTCRQRFLCNDSGRWVTASGVSCSNAASCPDTAPSTGDECAAENQICAIESVFCVCLPCVNFCDFPSWGCSRPGTGNCPALLPNDGQPCPSESDGRACEYGNCNLNEAVTVHCIEGRWTWTLRDCG